jgi:hypothetical protein
MQRWWNAGEPRQRTWTSRRQRCEAPVEDCGHVAGSAEVASEGGCLQVQEGVLLGSGREGEQVCAQGWPGGFSGEPRNVVPRLDRVLPQSGVRRALRLRREGRRCSTGPPGKAGPGSLSSRSKLLAETGASSRAMICCSVSVGVRGAIVSGGMRVWGSPSPTTWR